jgi:hypothetical protein
LQTVSLPYVSAAADGNRDASTVAEAVTPIEVKVLYGHAGLDEENDSAAAAAAATAASATSQVEMSSLLHGDAKT